MDARILQATLERDAFPTCVIAAASELNRCCGPLCPSQAHLPLEARSAAWFMYTQESAILACHKHPEQYYYPAFLAHTTSTSLISISKCMLHDRGHADSCLTPVSEPGLAEVRQAEPAGCWAASKTTWKRSPSLLRRTTRPQAGRPRAQCSCIALWTPARVRPWAIRRQSHHYRLDSRI